MATDSKNRIVRTPIPETIFGFIPYSSDVKIRYIPNNTNAMAVMPE
jgi:hypothetical protein